MLKSAQLVLLLLVAVFCFTGTFCPEIADAKKLQKKTQKFSLSALQRTYQKTESLEADFIQEVYQASLARTKTSQGALKLSKPSLLRWEIYEPEASIMVSNGRRVWYYTPDAGGKGKGQVVERKSQELQKQPLFRILTGAAKLNAEFTVLSLQEKKEALSKDSIWVTVELKPKQSMGDLAKATLKVNPKYLITEIIIENQSGNTTKITLQNQHLGAKLPPALFDFKPPEGTEILRQ